MAQSFGSDFTMMGVVDAGLDGGADGGADVIGVEVPEPPAPLAPLRAATRFATRFIFGTLKGSLCFVLQVVHSATNVQNVDKQHEHTNPCSIVFL
jgi:hypothetical protein